MAKSDGGGCAGCLSLVLIGSVVFAYCDLNEYSSEQRKAEKSTTATAAAKPAEPPEWRLGDDSPSGRTLLWVDMEKSEKLKLLRYVVAEDLNSSALDDLDDDEGLTPTDVEIKLLSKPRHGSVKLNTADGTATYTPREGFRGTDEFRYSLKLKGRPEVVEGTHSIEVDLSPGGKSREEFDNCAEARAAGSTPIREGEPGYGSHLDADGDGIGCEWG